MWTLLLSSAFSAAASLDQGPWQAVLDAHVDASGRVDYAAIAANHALDPYLAALGTAEEPLEPAERIAFWLNAYNAATVDLVADHFPVNSIRDLYGGKIWDTATVRVANRDLTLNQIENDFLRPMGDPRVHAALNCASLGCPPLSKTAYAGPTLDKQLVEASKRWMATNGITVDIAGKKVELSQIFDWYGADFTGMRHKDIPGLDGKQEAAVDYASRYLPADTAAFLVKGGYSVKYMSYDWALNKR